MTTPADRIGNLVSSGKISAAEGERLLLAITPSARARSPWQAIFNPFERFGGERAAVVGVVVCALSLGVGRLGAHFNGFMDVHLGEGGEVPTLGTSLLEQAASWLAPAILFWVYARFASSHGRLVDFVGFVGLSRALLVVVAFITVVLDPLPPTGKDPHITPAIALLAITTVPLIAWFGTLLYTGFKRIADLELIQVGSPSPLHNPT